MDLIALRRARIGLACVTLTFALAARAQAPVHPEPLLAALPRLAHLVAPDASLYPDYFGLALSRTSLQDDPQFRPLHLHRSGRSGDPAFIVLPVQTQAYGFSPTFRALLGARLDQELRRRHVDASTQTDIVDWRGPFVRRSDDATVAALAAEHPGSTLLTLYLGHDADGHAFLSLSRAKGGQSRIGHRRLDIPQEEIPTLDHFTAALPALLRQLDLGDARPAAAPAPSRGVRCNAADWDLVDLPPGTAPERLACHALIVGSLMPDFMASLSILSQPNSPDRLAWLARAWVEATALADKSPAMRSAATLASFQLRLDPDVIDPSALTGASDDVVRTLARTLWAHERTQKMSQNSRSTSTLEYVEGATGTLPAFVAALAVERGTFAEPFHQTDLCPIQLALPHLLIPAGCQNKDWPAPPRTRPASVQEIQLLDAWRLAAAWNDLALEGHMRGSASGIEQVLHDMPPLIAAHPFLHEMRFLVHENERQPREAGAHLAVTRAIIRDYANAFATLQRSDSVFIRHAAREAAALSSEGIDPTVLRLEDDLDRLTWVDDLDFHGLLLVRPQLKPDSPALFLAAGPFVQAQLAASRQASAASGLRSGGASQLDPPTPSTLISSSTFGLQTWWSMPSWQQLEQGLAKQPDDMNARLGLALLALERGDGIAAARRIIDSRPHQAYAKNPLGETIALAQAGHLFFFAGELQAARDYYARAAANDDGSEACLMARQRVALIDGNFAAAREATQRRLERYDADAAAADEAGYLFMQGKPDTAWQLIQSRVQTSREPALWRIALAGHRIAGDPLAALPRWVEDNKVERVVLEFQLTAISWMHAYAHLDRLPARPDPSVPHTSPGADLLFISANGLSTLRAAIDGRVDDLPTLTRDMQLAGGAGQTLLPFFAWDVWNATNGKEAVLDEVRKAPLGAGLSRSLAKAMVLAADGRRDAALRALTEARYELGRYGTEYSLHDDLRTGPYDFVLATWLMTRKTGEPAYATRGLAVALAYQHVQPYMAWPYAAEALLSKDRSAGALAACRAQRLDAGSMFLRESGLNPDPKSTVCRKATSWQ